LARTIYIRYIYGIFGKEIIKYTVIYGVYIRFWPTLLGIHDLCPMLCWELCSSLLSWSAAMPLKCLMRMRDHACMGSALLHLCEACCCYAFELQTRPHAEKTSDVICDGDSLVVLKRVREDTRCDGNSLVVQKRVIYSWTGDGNTGFTTRGQKRQEM